jgi:hypothetical protein
MSDAEFSKLNPADAKATLESFLRHGREDMPRLVDECRANGVILNFSPESILHAVNWAMPQLKSFPRPENPNVPEFIRNTDTYRSGLYDWDKASQELIDVIGFYFGEAFVRSFPQLKWTCGDQEFAFANMPVVAGFAHRKELQPIWVLNNLIRRVTEHPEKRDDIGIAVKSWIDNVPKRKA